MTQDNSVPPSGSGHSDSVPSPDGLGHSASVPNAGKQRWFTICEACDGDGDDGDILWATVCSECGGTGLVSTDLEDGEVLL